jgi:hypothetical protein
MSCSHLPATRSHGAAGILLAHCCFHVAASPGPHPQTYNVCDSGRRTADVYAASAGFFYAPLNRLMVA